MLCQEFVGNFARIEDMGHGDHGVTPEVGVHNDGLRVGVADDSQASVALEVVELILKFRTEITTLQTVYGAAEALFLIQCDKAGTLGA